MKCPYCSFEESHLEGNLIGMFLRKGRQYKAQKIFVYVFSIIVLGFWCVWGARWIESCFQSTRRTTGLHIPFWLNQLPIVVGMYGMFLYSIYHLIGSVKKRPEQYEIEALEKKQEQTQVFTTQQNSDAEGDEP